jgi:cell division protein FtsQ
MMVWHDTRAMNIIANAIYSLVMFVLLIFGVWWLSQRPMFTFQEIQVESMSNRTLDYVTTSAVRQSDVFHQKGNFFTLNLDSMRESFETIPWVRRARVRREWPNRLVVALEEYRAYAIWGESKLVNRDGEVFQANLGEAEAEGTLPRLQGPKGTEKQVVELYARLTEKLKSLDLVVDELTLTDRYAWRLTLDSGTEVALGRDTDKQQFAARIDRLVASYPVLLKTYGNLRTIDLRYATGLAFKADGLKVIEEKTLKPTQHSLVNAVKKPIVKTVKHNN